MDDKSINPQTIEAWLRSAQPQDVIQVAHSALDRVNTFTGTERDRFVNELSPQSRKLFEGQPVS